MGLTLKSISQFTEDLISGIIGALSGNPANLQITDFTPGEPALAWCQSVGEQFGFSQFQASELLLFARAATCEGPDLDSFVADYYLDPPRLPATYNSGPQRFVRRQAATQNVVLLVGTLVQNAAPSPSSAIQYQVIADTTNGAYSANAGGAGIGGYILTTGLTTFAQNPLVQALVAGTSSAVIAGTLSVIASPGVPFDTTTNPSDIDNGNNGETDAQLRQRFSDYISTRSGTRFAISAQIAGVQAGLSFVLNEYMNTDGSPRDGFTTAVVDDGSGNAPQSVINAITNAILDPQKGKSLGAQVVPIRPTIVPITVLVTGTTIKPGFSSLDVRAAMATAILSYVNSNGVGGAPAGTGSGTPSFKLSFSGVADVVASFIGSASGQGLASYGSVTVNGAQLDIALTGFQLARASSSSITIE